MKRTTLCLLGFFFVTSFYPAAWAADWCPLVIIVNNNSTMSQNIGERYRQKRKIPEEHVIRISCATDEEIDRTEYDTHIRDPIKSYLDTNGLADTIKYMVLTKGCPLKISGTGGPSTTAAAVDSELALLPRVPDYPIEGHVMNYYTWYWTNLLMDWDPRHYDMYLVTRLDGFEDDDDGDGVPDDIEHLIDDAFIIPIIGNPPLSGQYLIDVDPLWDLGDLSCEQNLQNMMRTAYSCLEPGGDVLFDDTSQFIGTASNLLAYCSWGSNDHQAPHDSRLLNLSFVPGSRATTFEPNAVTLNHVYVTDYWHIGDLIHNGLTGAAAYVNEIDCAHVADPDMLIMTCDWVLAEAIYMSLHWLSWQITVIGDPLCPTMQTFEEPPSSVEESLWMLY